MSGFPWRCSNTREARLKEVLYKETQALDERLSQVTFKCPSILEILSMILRFLPREVCQA